MLKRKTPLTRTAMPRNKSPHKRTPEQGGDELYLRWIRSLPCCVCGHRPPSDAHHSTGAGMGLKAPDREAMPLCRPHHQQFHELRGPFDGWSHSHKKLWQEQQVERCVALFLAEQLHDATGAPEEPTGSM
jgi:hypothetical protein